jgi:hypothetical protein
MLLVFLFGLAGIAVAREKIQYNSYIWLPIVLVVLSGAIVVVNTIRLFKRHTSK